jgi:hypothetical protein
MADFIPLVVRAVESLGTGASSESRHLIYSRMRLALSTALRAAEPPFTDEQIAREQLALEDAVRKVEGEIVDPATIDDEISADVPIMFVAGEGSGRFNRVWRVPWNLHATA